MTKTSTRPLYPVARSRSWSRWARSLPDWSLQALALLKDQPDRQLVLLEWQTAVERFDYLVHEYGLHRHSLILVVKSAAEETVALRSGWGDDVCREELLGEQLAARWERLHRRIGWQEVDPLTGLMHRVGGLKILELEIGLEQPEPLWLALFDLDHFKKINDERGHDGGDHVLRAVGRQLLLNLGGAPVICRFGGEEFLVVLRMSRAEAIDRVENFRAACGALEVLPGLRFTVSAGLVSHRPDESVQDLIGRADRCLYQAKAGGRNLLIPEDSGDGWNETSLDDDFVDFENRVRVYADRLVAGLTGRGRKMVEQSREEASHDGLTELFNRRYLDRRLEREVERSRKLRTPLTVVLLDLDDFGAVNRTYGYPAGDQALRLASEALQKAIRVVDWAGRYGGEELCAVFPDTGIDTASTIAERIRSSIEALQLEALDGRRFRITASLGVVSLQPEDSTPVHLIQRVSQAVRESKAQGKNRVTFGA